MKNNYSEDGISNEEQKQIFEFYNYLVDKYDELLGSMYKGKGISNKNKDKYIRKV